MPTTPKQKLKYFLSLAVSGDQFPLTIFQDEDEKREIPREIVVQELSLETEILKHLQEVRQKRRQGVFFEDEKKVFIIMSDHFRKLSPELQDEILTTFSPIYRSDL